MVFIQLSLKKRLSTYWWCQLGGWTFYGLSLLFVLWVFRIQISDIFIGRILVAISFGLIFTHILRLTILKLNITPPIFGKQWIVLFTITLLICIAYSYSNSTIVEWLQLYDPKMRATVSQRFLINLLNDSPTILVWVLFITCGIISKTLATQKSPAKE